MFCMVRFYNFKPTNLRIFEHIYLMWLLFSNTHELEKPSIQVYLLKMQ